MSFALMTQVWASGPPDATAKLVLLALADYANDAGECWPSMASLAEKCSISERTARQAVRRLEVDGWLSTSVGGGRHGCSKYRINPAANAGYSEGKPGSKCPLSGPENPAEYAPPRQNTSQNPAEYAPEPIRNLSEEDPRSSAAAASFTRDAAAAQDGPTYRERILSACGLKDPVSGLTGYGSARLGTPADMAVANRWVAAAPQGLGLTESEVVAVVADKRASMRGPPARLAYFDGAMADFAAARDRPIPSPRNQQTTPAAAQIARWQRLASGGQS